MTYSGKTKTGVIPIEMAFTDRPSCVDANSHDHEPDRPFGKQLCGTIIAHGVCVPSRVIPGNFTGEACKLKYYLRDHVK